LWTGEGSLTQTCCALSFSGRERVALDITKRGGTTINTIAGTSVEDEYLAAVGGIREASLVMV
jgi:hypothetical protein